MLVLSEPTRAVVSSAGSDTLRFLRRVLPEPSQGRALGIHWFDNTGGAKKRRAEKGFKGSPMGGRAYYTAESAASYAQWMLNTYTSRGDNALDLYACMALCGMEHMEQYEGGKPALKPTRQGPAARAVRGLWADLDVKDKAYKSQDEALAHIDALVADGSLPEPTVRVSSGNGVHLHWILDRELSPQEWSVLARPFSDYLKSLGIHHDTNCTVDVVRVLRLPGTLNCKDPANPLPVEIVGQMLPDDIPVADIEALLGKSVSTAQPVRTASARAAPAMALPDAFAGGNQLAQHDPTWKAGQSEFAGGIDEPDPLDFPAVVENCPTLTGMLARHGAGDAGVLWGLALLATTFIVPQDEGRRWAHEFSSGYVSYSPDETDRKFDDKVHARAQSNGRIGWPTCAAFSALASECQTCPLNGKGKSPLHAGRVQAVPALADPVDLPDGYYRKEGEIWHRATAAKKEDGEPEPDACVMPYDVLNACIEGPPDNLVFTAQIIHKKNPPRTLTLPVAAAMAWRDDATKAMGTTGIVLQQEQLALSRRFFVAYIQMLQKAQANHTARDPFGWVTAKDGDLGFSYGGRVYRHDGTEEAAARADPTLQHIYQPAGAAQPWKDAAGMLLGMGRTDIQAIIATAFAAPLVHFTGHKGAMFSAIGESGVQKSSAMQVAQAVWGDPIRGMNKLNDTTNSVGKKLGQLRHLPVFWDELRKPDDAEAFVNLGFQLAQGLERSRMQANTDLRESGSWATLVVAASNSSIREIMLQGSAKNSDAGVNRLLEIQVSMVPLTIISPSAAQLLVGETHENYGHAGALYAKMLATHAPLLKDRLNRVAESLFKATGSGPAERFWVMIASTILFGAAMANTLDGGNLIKFDVPALKVFLIDAIKRQHVMRADDVVQTGTEDFAVDVLQAYIAHLRTRHECLETDTVPSGPGKPKPTRLLMPNANAAANLRAPKMHIIHTDGVIRILLADFRNWVTVDRKQSFQVVRDTLEKYGGMTKKRLTWCGGTQWAGVQQDMLVIDVHHANTPLGARFDYGHPV